ncbi:MAG: hypothetical protein ACW964_17700 [Candidatus Hodarchaeales archaeon]
MKTASIISLLGNAHNKHLTKVEFQIFGPLAIKWAVERSGEARSC